MLQWDVVFHCQLRARVSRGDTVPPSAFNVGVWLCIWWNWTRGDSALMLGSDVHALLKFEAVDIH